MASHSSVLAWRIPGMGEPGGLLSMGSHRVRHNGSDLAAAAASHSQESSPAPRFKSVHSLVPSLLYGLTLTSIHDYWKAIALTIWTFVSKVMSLLFNTLSRLIITFLPRSKTSFNFIPAAAICSDFEAQENKVCTVSIASPSICHEMMELDAMIFIF